MFIVKWNKMPAKIENYCSTDIFHAQEASQKYYIPFIIKTLGHFFLCIFCYLEEYIYLLEYIYLETYTHTWNIYLNHCFIPHALNVLTKWSILDWRLMDFHRKFSYSNECWNHACFPYNFSNAWQKSLYLFLSTFSDLHSLVLNTVR